MATTKKPAKKEILELNLSVKKFNKNFTERYQQSEQYVALQNKNIGRLSGWDDNSITDEALEILVKITNEQNNESIYRRAVGYTEGNFTANDIMLGYRSIKRLQVNVGDIVIIKPTCWFCYLWHHAQTPVRYPFRIAIIVGVLSLFFSIVSIGMSIYQMLHCC